MSASHRTAVLLIIWLALSIIGAIIEGLLWLSIVSAVLFVGTVAFGYLRHRSDRRSLER